MGKKSRNLVHESTVSSKAPSISKVLSNKQINLQALNVELTEQVLKQMDKTALANRLSYVEATFNECSALENKFYETCDNEDELQSTFMPVYFELKDKISREINTRAGLARSSTFRKFSEADAPIAIEMVQRTRIPEIQIPKFSGTYTEWPDFISLFNSVIDNSTDLSTLEKYQHLRVSLKGAALDIIRSLELNEQNYDKAMQLLKKRFDNKTLIFQAHLKEIFGLRDVANGSAAGMRELSDKINAHLNSLQTIGTKEEIADGMLIHVICNKLDHSSQAKWEELLSNSELPSWGAMSSFLEKRARTLEKLSANPAHLALQPAKKGNAHLTTSKVSKCAFCNSDDHWISSCPDFISLSVSARFKNAKRLQLCLNCLRKGHSVQGCKSGNCRNCALKHNTLLHMSTTTPSPPLRPQAVAFSPNEKSQTPAACISTSPPSPSMTNQGYAPENVALLATAIILVKNHAGSFVPYRALLDSASQINFVTTRLVSQLKLRTVPSSVKISGIANSTFTSNKSVEINAKAQSTGYDISFSAVVAQTITDYQPNFNLNTPGWCVPKNIKLADPLFCNTQHIDVLIGTSLFFDLLCVGQIRVANDLPILQKTKLGWVASGGGLVANHKPSTLAAIQGFANSEEDVKLDSIVSKFWEIETCPNEKSALTTEEINCEAHFQKNFVRLATGEYAVRLPFKQDPDTLGNSHNQATLRFKSLERKLNRNDSLKAQYSAFLKEYQDLSHMAPANSNGKTKIYILPHHCVYKDDSSTTKLRVVFDGSCKTSNGISLNNILMNGPTIQPKLFHTLIRFRSFQIALTGDICKMYRCIRVLPPDNYLQCILWREDPSQQVNLFTLNTVTYGTKSAAFLAIRAMHQLSFDEERNFPLGAKIVRRDFYVDDLISGGNTVEDVQKIRNETTQLLSKGKFIIRKWCSNDQAILNDIREEDREKFLTFHDGTDVTKTLGLIWEPKMDNFIFSVSSMELSKITTKRTILSTIARFYDPLGLIGPIITKAKIFMQSLWKENIHWDESLPQQILAKWAAFCSDFDELRNFSFSRCVTMPNADMQIHGFCDASQTAYGACVYIRTSYNGLVQTHLLCSKSRVAPLKSLTIPKLELCAASLLSELLNTIKRTDVFEGKFHCWSDSSVVLAWLRDHSSKFNVFVANRVSSVQALTTGMEWHYVHTHSNPADILSRGAAPSELLNSSLWKHGPPFLKSEQSQWPQMPNNIIDVPERRRMALVTTACNEDISLQIKYHNSFATTQKIFAYIARIWSRKGRRGFPKSNFTEIPPLTPEEIKVGTWLMCRSIQRVHFEAEIKALREGKVISSASNITSLNPFIDEFGLLRVGGRLKNSLLDFAARHPIILPQRHPVTIALIKHFHLRFLHAGPLSLLASIRLQFWPIGGRKAVSSILNQCLKCFRLKPKLFEQIMGDLPQDRVQCMRAFLVTGIDFCGPFYYKPAVRNKGPVKCYICLFICFSTKATHLEVVADLSTSSFLAALKRFISIRGTPRVIWSDNATNFVGARNELVELKNLFASQPHIDAVHRQCLADGIEWRFIPPRSPHFGGLWEAAVKAAKYHFYRAVGLAALALEELQTLVCQISAIINSRPLCPITENPSDLEVLTPAHFLIGAPFTSFPEPDITYLDLNRLDRWQRVCSIQQTFWKKWSTNYLTLLQERGKWRFAAPNLHTGMLVLIKDENLPPLKWQLGRIAEIICGGDGVARVAVINTSSGLTRRAVHKLAVLPMLHTPVERLEPSKGGGCSEQNIISF